MDLKATLRASKLKGPKLPKLREEAPKTENAVAKDGKERLQKILAAAGVCSRRKAEELILLGEVKVNGEVVNQLGAKANPQEDVISVEGKVIDFGGQERAYYLLNKPRGYITSTTDPQGRPTVMELMAGVKERVYPVGRLDYASEGLLLFTNDGELANKIMHPSSEVRRAYAVKIRGKISDEQIRQLKRGIQLSDGFVRPLKVKRGDRLENKEWIEIEITEGKNLEIRRIFAVIGVEVDRLRRTSIGPIEIGMVPVGRFVKISRRDVESILTDAAAGKKKRAAFAAAKND